MEKLKNRKLIEQLFEEGGTVSVYPLRVFFMPAPFEGENSIKVGVSVSKRNFKHAVSRNRIKRLLREAFRLNKSDVFNNMTTQYALMILYIGKAEPSFEEVNSAMKAVLKKMERIVMS